MTFVEDTKYFNKRAKLRTKCKCGCSCYIPNFRDRVICRWCGRTVYRNKKEEFITKLNAEINKIKK